MHASNSSLENRRKSLRHYLSRNIPAELVFGRQRIAVESGRIADISDAGIGIRAAQPVPLKPGAAVTVATTVADRVVTLSGRVAFARHGRDLGIEIAGREDRDRLGEIAGCNDSVAVANPDGQRTHVSGKVSMAARHPIRWALQAGVSRLDLSRATDIDSSGLGLLLMLNERDGLRIENCADQVCRLVDLTRLQRICIADCPKRSLPTP